MLKHTNMLENDANPFCFLASIVQNNVIGSPRKKLDSYRLIQKKEEERKKTHKDTHNATVRK